jgi:hypothetical protein
MVVTLAAFRAWIGAPEACKKTHQRSLKRSLTGRLHVARPLSLSTTKKPPLKVGVHAAPEGSNQ